jgi:uncharacterized damage-inducible protein DinB
MSISETLLPEFDQEMASTRKLLERVPEGKLAWKPHEKSMALGRLAGHVTELPGWAIQTVRVEVLDLTPEGGPPMQAYSVRSVTEMLETFDKNVSEGRAAIAGATDEHLHKMWSLKFRGQIVLTMPRSAVLRNVVMNHLIHHRAQLGVYLRLNDVAIPGMYGPSADEGRMFAAQ